MNKHFFPHKLLIARIIIYKKKKRANINVNIVTKISNGLWISYLGIQVLKLVDI